MSDPSGIVVPLIDGKRSTSALGRGVVADALREVDPVGAAAAERETDWRRGYPIHFRRLVEAGLLSQDAAVTIAREGLNSVHRRMAAVVGGTEVPMDDVFDTASDRSLTTSIVRGAGAAETELSLPFHGTRLRGDALRKQLDAWVAQGSLEPSAADAVREVLAHPEWLKLDGRTVVVLGATSEMGPLQSLLRWGATVAAVDLPRRELWSQTLGLARAGAGTLLIPVASEGMIEDRAGADLLHDLPAVADWINRIAGPVVLGNYVYADGVLNLRLSAAVDALTTRLQSARNDLSLAFLATPTDVFGVPAEAMKFSQAAYDAAKLGKTVRPLMRGLSGGRLLRRNYAPGSEPGLVDSVVRQQGPNYLLAKRIQRWRATVARRDGLDVSMLVAPPTRTKSVMKNRALAAAYAGAHRFRVEAFAPATSNTLMAALLVHDLMAGPRPLREPWREEADKATHGGLWRGPYTPSSALGLAVVLGFGRSKS